jgi:hypothetical protein
MERKAKSTQKVFEDELLSKSPLVRPRKKLEVITNTWPRKISFTYVCWVKLTQIRIRFLDLFLAVLKLRALQPEC